MAFKTFVGASEDLIKNLRGVAPLAELNGDEVGNLVDQVAEIRLEQQKQPKASLNLLWALAAGVIDCDWRELTEAAKQRLRKEAGEE